MKRVGGIGMPFSQSGCSPS